MADNSRNDGETRRGLVTRRGAVGAAGGMALAGLAAGASQAQAQAQPGKLTPPTGAPSILYPHESPTRSTRSLAATCANCHGTQGRSAEGSSVTSLAGLDKTYIVAQMKAFQSGARPATVMHQLSKGYTDAQIDQIAGYFAAQKK